MPPPREVPLTIRQTHYAWRRWSSIWNWVHYTTGFTSAGLTVIIAANANAKPQFLNPIPTAVLAAFAARLAFLVTAMGAGTKGKGFELAGREIELARAKFQLNPEIPESTLGDAVEKGVQILNNVK